MKRWIRFAVLTIAALALPAYSRADSFTFALSGDSQQGVATSFSLSVSGGPRPVNQLFILTPVSDPLDSVLLADLGTGDLIPSVTVDAFLTFNGVSTLVEILEFDDAVVTNIADLTQAGPPFIIATFAYKTETITTVGGGTPTAPEPSEMILLGIGLAGLCSLRKRLHA